MVKKYKEEVEKIKELVRAFLNGKLRISELEETLERLKVNAKTIEDYTKNINIDYSGVEGKILYQLLPDVVNALIRGCPQDKVRIYFNGCRPHDIGYKVRGKTIEIIGDVGRGLGNSSQDCKIILIGECEDVGKNSTSEFYIEKGYGKIHPTCMGEVYFGGKKVHP